MSILGDCEIWEFRVILCLFRKTKEFSAQNAVQYTVRITQFWRHYWMVLNNWNWLLWVSQKPARKKRVWKEVRERLLIAQSPKLLALWLVWFLLVICVQVWHFPPDFLTKLYKFVGKKSAKICQYVKIGIWDKITIKVDQPVDCFLFLLSSKIWRWYIL